MKSPPFQHHDDQCRDEVEDFIAKYRRVVPKGGARTEGGTVLIRPSRRRIGVMSDSSEPP